MNEEDKIYITENANLPELVVTPTKNSSEEKAIEQAYLNRFKNRRLDIPVNNTSAQSKWFNRGIQSQRRALHNSPWMWGLRGLVAAPAGGLSTMYKIGKPLVGTYLGYKGVSNMANTIRRRLYDNVSPFGYDNPVERVASAVLLNKPSEKQEYYGKTALLDDLWGTYLDIPNNQRHYKRVLQKSKYKPSKRYTKNSEYYKLDYTPEEQLEIILKGLHGQDKGVNPELGKFTIGSGNDAKGHYVSYYDTWDINPFRGITNQGNKLTSLLGLEKVNDLSLGLGKPLEIYDRIYLDDYYGVSKEDKGHTYLPEITIDG